jgi:16S rRNA (cytidine1402-2'-O)-methyltransferase
MAGIGKLFLIPTVIAEGTEKSCLSPQVAEVVKHCQYFLVENVRTARRFISSLQLGIDITALQLEELNKDTPDAQISSLVKPLLEGKDIGIMSEAGCPGIADPGARAVAKAHELNAQVVPLVGPSSIFLALMASGFSGQQFAFHGYLPIDKQARTKKLKELEQESRSKGQTQIFMETPYRNGQLLADIVNQCSGSSMLCVAANINSPSEFIVSKRVHEWKKIPVDLHKIPSVFLLAAY